MRISIEGNIATGKCLGYGQGLLMYSGAIKEVQDIVVGDELMGDDSTPRVVLALCSGREEMFNVIPRKGQPFIATRNHILCLQTPGKPSLYFNKNKRGYVVRWFDCKSLSYRRKRFQTSIDALAYTRHCSQEVGLELSVGAFLKLSPTQQSCMKAYRVGVDFIHAEPPFDPWIIGYWLGNESDGSALITTADPAIVDTMNRRLDSQDLMLEKQAAKNSWKITQKYEGGENSFLNALWQLDILSDRKVPDQLKFTSRSVRCALLAGLIDSSGHFTGEYFQITEGSSSKLADDIVFLSRSLGLACYQKTHGQISISGQFLDLLPTVLERKQARKPHADRLEKNTLQTSIRVESVGCADYYGFETDGNHRFLLSDFTVTHNSTLLKSLAKSWRVFEEPVNEWQPILGLFYADPPRWCLQMNLQALLSFFRVPDDGVVISERSPLSCKEVFARLGKNDGILTEKEWNLFSDMYNSTAWIPDVIIYLASPSAVCLQRAQQRGRSGEEPLSHDYISRVQFAHNTMLRWYTNEVHVVDATQDAAAVLARVEDILAAYKK